MGKSLGLELVYLLCIVISIMHLFPVLLVSMLGEVQNKLKTAYKHVCNSDSPHYYNTAGIVPYRPGNPLTFSQRQSQTNYPISNSQKLV